MKHKPLAEQVVVVVGASSGIGRETCLQLAPRAAAIVAAARNEHALATLAAEVESVGGTIETIVADVTEWQDISTIAARAVQRFGRIDTWVNDASVTVYGRYELMDPNEIRRVVETNLVGVMLGALAALPHVKQSRGVIVNVGSVLSGRAVPLQVPYVAAKHGVKGFSDALRLELESDGSGVEVTTIMPSSMNTPLFENARSKLAVQPMPVPPVYDPMLVADAILHAAENGGREIVVGGAGRLLVESQRLSARLTDKFMLQNDLAFKQQLTDRPNDGYDNLFAPSRGPGSVRGDFGEGSKRSSLYTRLLEYHPARKRALTMAALAGAVVLLSRAGAYASRR